MKRQFWPLAIVVFGLLVAITYLPVFTGKVPFPRDLVLRHAAWDGQRPEPPRSAPEIGDLITSFYPFHFLASHAMSEGALPLWNPYILGGAPFEANSQSALLYPFNFLYYVLPVAAAWTLCLIIRMFLAAIFMALLVRLVGASTVGAIVSGIIFASCGFTTAWQGQALGDAAIWLPLVCYSVLRLHDERSYGSIALAAFAFAMPVLAGHPETALHVTATGSALALFLWIFPNRSDVHALDRRFLLCFFIVGVLALGLASVQMIPSLEWLKQMGSPFDEPWPALSRHDGQGFFSRDLTTSPNSAGLAIPETAAYLGMFSLLLAPFALFHKSRRYVFFFYLVTIVAAAIAYGVEPVHWIVAHTPVIKSLKNGRLILVVSFGIAALAGLGVCALQAWAENTTARQRKTGLTLLFITGIVSAFCIYETKLATLRPVGWTRGPAASLIFLIIGGLVLGWRVTGGLKGRLFPILAFTLLVIELASFNYGYTGYTQPAEIFPTAPVYEFLRSRSDHGTFRIAKAGFPIPANSGIIYGVETADGYEVCTASTKLFTADLTEDRQDAVFFLADKLAQNRDRRLDMLNVRYLVVIKPSPEFEQFASRPDKYAEVYNQGSMAVFENKSVLPRLFAVPQSGVEIIRKAEDQLERIKDPEFDPERTVLLAETPAAPRTENSLEGPIISLKRSGNNESTFQVQIAEPSVLVLSQIYYPGWKATIDGAPAPVYAVDYALTGILAPAGSHEVRFLFAPPSFTIGAMLSGLSLVLLLGLGLCGLSKKLPAKPTD